MDLDQPPVVRIDVGTSEDVDPLAWPMTIPAVDQLAREGLELPRGVTFLVGENGSGKSTLVEAVAAAYGLSGEGGSTHSRHATRATESPLASALRLQRGVGASRWGFFLRAETMHGWYTYMDDHGGPRDPDYHAMSHGESFLAVLRAKFDGPAFYCLDEPEAALSFSSTLALIGVLHDLQRAGAQVLCATHSPVLASLPGARILEVGEWGYRAASWEDLELVTHWRAYLASPGRYLRHVLD
ncbi:AAA family ATPase [Nocardioides dongxiaopingii]|uniref:AAA family ATPase n=1 Tax=Nocardioides dongxiaopingii TaxID=2576036 RepID=UPI0010C770CB|nr:AAA family ATPase [Nocardioides dongxiaopingii]